MNEKKPRSPRGSGNDLINGDYKQLPVSVSQILYDEVATLAAAYYKTHGYSGRKPRGNGTALFAKELLLCGIKEFKRVQQQNVQTMSSLEIAELTGKQHKHVLRDIRNIEKSLSPELGLGFKSTTYTDSTGRTNPCYNLDKDSTTLSLVTM